MHFSLAPSERLERERERREIVKRRKEKRRLPVAGSCCLLLDLTAASTWRGLIWSPASPMSRFASWFASEAHTRLGSLLLFDLMSEAAKSALARQTNVKMLDDLRFFCFQLFVRLTNLDTCCVGSISLLLRFHFRRLCLSSSFVCVSLLSQLLFSPLRSACWLAQRRASSAAL